MEVIDLFPYLNPIDDWNTHPKYPLQDMYVAQQRLPARAVRMRLTPRQASYCTQLVQITGAKVNNMRQWDSRKIAMFDNSTNPVSPITKFYDEEMMGMARRECFFHPAVL